ncbi:hypothetical protein IF1G_07907 [Cordyceps javanica]|uniref:Uncharacterized protein n=1 Tax=Cordyceps javanica TaxID=43265 RepID=A0A545UV37_9HYPO|nr:hypothetical protein IF1G_07907 [Cordyceps javanica]TQW05316.1 hypothetical protein IF2G_07253 [Cordyceps javanica]
MKPVRDRAWPTTSTPCSSATQDVTKFTDDAHWITTSSCDVYAVRADADQVCSEAKKTLWERQLKGKGEVGNRRIVVIIGVFKTGQFLGLNLSTSKGEAILKGQMSRRCIVDVLSRLAWPRLRREQDNTQ